MTRRFLLSLLIFLFIALIVFPDFALAAEEGGWWDRFLGVFTDPLAALGRLVANVLAIAVLIFSGIAPVLGIAAGIAYGAMLGLVLITTGLFAVIKPAIEATLSIPVIPGREIAVVTQGWAFSRDIVSMFFIVILVFIGLATILRLETYQAQKTLPLLIIMALLINFSGLIVGFVVDMANIITFAFIKPIEAHNILYESLNTTAEELQKAIIQIPIGLFGTDPMTFFMETFLSPVLGAAARAIFYLIFIIVLLIVLFLFIIRVGVLWILTILAPFAFAAYILPTTRGWWTQWWQSLFQWAFIGAPTAFFLLLAMEITHIPQISDAIKAIEAIDAIEATRIGWFGNILIEFIQPLFALLFLIVGLSISITFVPKGAQFVTSAAQKGFKTAGVVAAKQAWAPTQIVTQKAGKSIGAFYSKAKDEGLRQAIKHAWTKKPSIRPKWAQTKAAAKGVWAATQASASAGWGAAWGQKRKGQKKCPDCGQQVAASAKVCTHPGCGADLS